MNNPYYTPGIAIKDYPHHVYYGHISKTTAPDTSVAKTVTVKVPVAIAQPPGEPTRHVMEEREAVVRSGTDVIARIYDHRPETMLQILAEKEFRSPGAPRNFDEQQLMHAENLHAADAWLVEQMEQFRFDSLEEETS